MAKNLELSQSLTQQFEAVVRANYKQARKIDLFMSLFNEDLERLGAETMAVGFSPEAQLHEYELSQLSGSPSYNTGHVLAQKGTPNTGTYIKNVNENTHG